MELPIGEQGLKVPAGPFLGAHLRRLRDARRPPLPTRLGWWYTFASHLSAMSLIAAIALYVVHYNFCRMHGSLPGTPAMAARLTGHPWSMEELLEEAE
jgi:hypothetical protein